jgi:hypothetical protein
VGQHVCHHVGALSVSMCSGLKKIKLIRNYIELSFITKKWIFSYLDGVLGTSSTNASAGQRHASQSTTS